ncbi:hypothetical protein HGRIS_000161 [Hohenbuehelia grisea]|uniref:Uncharacterized protein n=1 Tax=Hohenbuehelia grisea TaxID=104357 RepID=A0ABR3JQV3_9AGAR
MSYSFHGQYPENYSTPTTPHSFPAWEIEANPQQQQHQQAQQQADPTQHPSTPQEQHQHTFPVMNTIHLGEVPERIVPSQAREALAQQQHQDIHALRLNPAQFASHPEGRSDSGAAPSGHARPLPHIDTARPSTSPTASSTLLMRRSPSVARPHPYRRPQSAAGTHAGSSAMPAPPAGRARDTSSHVRFHGSGGSSVMPSPISAPPRMTSFGSAGPSGSSSPMGTVTHIAETPSLSRRPEQHVHQYTPRSDVHYDPDSQQLTAMLELPGVRKADMIIKLLTCAWNRVKQVTITGRSNSIFPPDALAVRERKFGIFSRTFAVPAETKPDFPKPGSRKSPPLNLDG